MMTRCFGTEIWNLSDVRLKRSASMESCIAGEVDDVEWKQVKRRREERERLGIFPCGTYRA